MISIQNLNYKYDNNLNSLNNVNLTIEKGEKLAFTGIDGYDGKKIFLKLITGLEKSKEGTIFIDYKNIDVIDFSQDVSMAYLSKETPFFYTKTVYKNLEYVYNIRNVFDGYELKIQDALKKFGILSLMDKRIKSLTDFEKILVALCRISLRNIDYFVIEDIFDGLQTQEIDSILNKILLIL